MCTDDFIRLWNWYTKYVMKQSLAFFSYANFVVALLLWPSFTQAASLYIDPAMTSLNRGDSVTMAIRLDTDEAAGECVNAVDGVLTYSSNIEPVDVSTGQSIFNIWVESPIINKADRTITFAGGIPNGYCGRVQGDPKLTNILAEVVFRSPGFSITDGGSGGDVAEIAFSDESTAYLNDGRGTKATLKTYGSTIKLAKGAGSTLVNDWKTKVAEDTIPPEKFSILLEKGDKSFSEKYYIIFNTTDKQTGIDQYQVMEEPLTQFGSFQWGRANAPWLSAKSPYILSDQTLNSIIRVKAVDKAGNEYVANYIPDDSMRTLSQNQIFSIFALIGGTIILLIVSFFAFRFVQKRRRKISSHAKETELVNEDDLYDKE